MLNEFFKKLDNTYKNKLDSWEIRKIIHIEKDEWCLVCNFHLGETYVTCSLIRDFLKRHGGEKIVVVVPKKYKDIPKMFPAITRTIAYDDRLTIRVPTFHLFSFIDVLPGRLSSFLFSRLLDHRPGTILFHTHYPLRSHKKKDRDYGMLDETYWWMGIPNDAKPPPPVISQDVSLKARQHFRDLNLSEGKTVILYPYSYSMEMLDQEWWVSIRDKVKELGWTPVTNIAGSERPIDGTIGVVNPIEEQIPFSELAGWIVGTRSGIFDVLSSSKCKKTILYNYATGSTELGKVDTPERVSRMYNVKNIEEFNLYRKQCSEKLVDQIVTPP